MNTGIRRVIQFIYSSFVSWVSKKAFFYIVHMIDIFEALVLNFDITIIIVRQLIPKVAYQNVYMTLSMSIGQGPIYLLAPCGYRANV